MESPLVHRLGRCVFALDLQDAHNKVLHTIVSISATSFLHTDYATGYREKDTTSLVGPTCNQPQPCTHMIHPIAASAQANQRPQHAQAELR